jgi:hypothetical protein
MSYTYTPDPNIEEVRILNSENHTHYYEYMRSNRLKAFYDFIVKDRRPNNSPKMPGLSGRALAGLDAIFARRPAKFPYQDILKWFRDEQKTYLGDYPNPTITVEEIEDALERFSELYPPDVSAK